MFCFLYPQVYKKWGVKKFFRSLRLQNCTPYLQNCGAAPASICFKSGYIGLSGTGFVICTGGCFSSHSTDIINTERSQNRRLV